MKTRRRSENGSACKTVCEDVYEIFFLGYKWINLSFIPHHMTVAEYYGFVLVSICLSLQLSASQLYIRPYFRFRMITLVNVNGFSPNLVYALI